MAPRDFRSCAIVLNQLRMIYGHVLGALLKIRFPHRVATRLHDIADEPVGFRDCFSGIIHEASLNRTPGFGETVPVQGCEGADTKPIEPLLALFERGLSMPLVAVFPHYTIVFGPESAPQVLTVLLAHEHPSSECNANHDQDNDRHGR